MSTIDYVSHSAYCSPMNNISCNDNPQGLGLLMPLVGQIMCYVRQRASHIYKQQGYNITPEAADALYIIRNFDGLPQKKLAEILGKDKASITRLLNALVKINLVERIHDQEDRRVIRAHITQEGKEAHLKIYPEFKALSDTVLTNITEHNFNNTLAVLNKIITNLPCQKLDKE